MRILSLALVAVTSLVITLVVLNWAAIVTPGPLSLGVTTVQMPLALSVLGLMGLVSGLLVAYVVYLQGSALMEARRLSKALQSHRELADKAEASRFTELRTYLADALAAQAARQSEAQQSLLTRLAQVEERQHTHIEHTGNALAAAVGELEDKVERALSRVER